MNRRWVTSPPPPPQPPPPPPPPPPQPPTPSPPPQVSSFAQENTLLKPQGGESTWSDSTPVVSACSSMSRLQSMLVAVKQSPRSTMSTFNTSVTEALCLLGGA